MKQVCKSQEHTQKQTAAHMWWAQIQVMHLQKGSAGCKEYGGYMVDADPITRWVGRGRLLQGSDI